MENSNCVSSIGSIVLISLAVSCSVVYINNWFLYKHACPSANPDSNSDK